MEKQEKRTTKINVDVTQDDIDRAIKNNSSKCVVAQAIARTVTDATVIDVDTQSIRFTRPQTGRLMYLTPYVVQGYIIGFDAGDDIEPFRFQLKQPVSIHRRVNTTKGKKRLQAARAKQAGNTGEAAKLSEEIAALSGPAIKEIKGSRRSPPRVFKSKKRMYGGRLLRINKDQQASP